MITSRGGDDRAVLVTASVEGLRAEAGAGLVAADRERDGTVDHAARRFRLHCGDGETGMRLVPLRTLARARNRVRTIVTKSPSKVTVPLWPLAMNDAGFIEVTPVG